MKRNNKITIRLNSEERKVIETKAKILGMSISTFMRTLALRGSIQIQ